MFKIRLNRTSLTDPRVYGFYVDILIVKSLHRETKRIRIHIKIGLKTEFEIEMRHLKESLLCKIICLSGYLWQRKT